MFSAKQNISTGVLEVMYLACNEWHIITNLENLMALILHCVNFGKISLFSLFFFFFDYENWWISMINLNKAFFRNSPDLSFKKVYYDNFSRTLHNPIFCKDILFLVYRMEPPLGTIHKRRLLRGGGRGVQKMAFWGDFQGLIGETGGGRVVKN